MTEMLFNFSTWVIPILFAITLHEAAHGYAANALGDPTAKALGRLSLNPLRHIELFGTIILPGLLFLFAPFVLGWAKPVPVNPRNFKDPRRDMLWVALAGPAMNIALAVLAVLSLRLIVPMAAGFEQQWLYETAFNMLKLNLILAVFNMIPLPPLDGGRVLVGILPLALARKVAALEEKGMLILVFLLIILPMIGQQLNMNLSLIGYVVGEPVQWLGRVLLTVFGP